MLEIIKVLLSHHDRRPRADSACLRTLERENNKDPKLFHANCKLGAVAGFDLQ